MRAAIAGALLGLIFIFAAVAYFFHLMPTPTFPPGSLIPQFMGPFIASHYMDFVKVVELSGGILVAIPATRRLGLLFLGPVIVNILAFTALVARGGWGNPLLIAAVVLALYLVWEERRAFAAFLAGGIRTTPPTPHVAVDENAPTKLQEATRGVR